MAFSKQKCNDLFDITEDEMEDMTDSFKKSLEDVFGETQYVKNARISTANSNARQANTAMSATLTQLGISNFDFGYYNDYAVATFGKAEDGVIRVDWSGVDYYPSDESADLISYLGEDFTGYSYVVFNTYTYSVKYALWSEEPIPSEYLYNLSEYEQKEIANAGQVIGCYPLNY